MTRQERADQRREMCLHCRGRKDAPCICSGYSFYRRMAQLQAGKIAIAQQLGLGLAGALGVGIAAPLGMQRAIQRAILHCPYCGK
jgi:hypothetical protein